MTVYPIVVVFTQGENVIDVIIYELIQTHKSIPTRIHKKESRRVQCSCFVRESELICY